VRPAIRQLLHDDMLGDAIEDDDGGGESERDAAPVVLLWFVLRG
jgi:hypothetical protein